eukprot:1088222-Prorocentrum_minimum.AAC.1
MTAPASTKCLGGELNSPVVEWLNKGLMATLSPNNAPAIPAAASACPRLPFTAPTMRGGARGVELIRASAARASPRGTSRSSSSSP